VIMESCGSRVFLDLSSDHGVLWV